MGMIGNEDSMRMIHVHQWKALGSMHDSRLGG
jgi:hypothetical protein